MSTTRLVVYVVSALVAALFAWIGLAIVANAVADARVPVSLPPGMSVINIDDVYVTASGTWKMVGDEPAFPLQTTTINCEKALRRCTSATVWFIENQQAQLFLDYYDIVEWSKSQIVFVDDSSNCARYVYTIDLRTKSANGLREKREIPTKPVAVDCDLINDGVRLTLVDGFTVRYNLHSKALPWFAGLIGIHTKGINQ